MEVSYVPPLGTLSTGALLELLEELSLELLLEELSLELLLEELSPELLLEELSPELLLEELSPELLLEELSLELLLEELSSEPLTEELPPVLLSSEGLLSELLSETEDELPGSSELLLQPVRAAAITDAARIAAKIFFIDFVLSIKLSDRRQVAISRLLSPTGLLLYCYTILLRIAGPFGCTIR